MLFCTTKPRFSELALDADSIDTKIDDFGGNFSDDDGNGTPEFRSFSPQISTVDSPFNINYNKLATSPISRHSREINSKTHQNGDQFAPNTTQSNTQPRYVPNVPHNLPAQYSLTDRISYPTEQRHPPVGPAPINIRSTSQSDSNVSPDFSDSEEFRSDAHQSDSTSRPNCARNLIVPNTQRTTEVLLQSGVHYNPTNPEGGQNPSWFVITSDPSLAARSPLSYLAKDKSVEGVLVPRTNDHFEWATNTRPKPPGSTCFRCRTQPEGAPPWDLRPSEHGSGGSIQFLLLPTFAFCFPCIQCIKLAGGLILVQHRLQ